MTDMLLERLRSLTENITPLKRALATKVYDIDGIHSVVLYGTRVFYYDENTGTLILNNGGYVTQTTAARMEKAFEEYGLKGLLIRRKQGQMYLVINNTIPIPFDDNGRLEINLNDLTSVMDDYLANYKRGDVSFSNTTYTEIPNNIQKIKGNLNLSNSLIKQIPDGLVVTGNIYIGGNKIELPSHFKASALVIDKPEDVDYIPEGADVDRYVIGYQTMDGYYDIAEYFPELVDPNWVDYDKMFDEGATDED